MQFIDIHLIIKTPGLDSLNIADSIIPIFENNNDLTRRFDASFSSRIRMSTYFITDSLFTTASTLFVYSFDANFSNDTYLYWGEGTKRIYLKPIDKDFWDKLKPDLDFFLTLSTVYLKLFVKLNYLKLLVSYFIIILLVSL